MPAAAPSDPGLRPHQREAVDAITKAFTADRLERATVVSACGTGKTRMAIGAVQHLTPQGRVLVVVPTRELLVPAEEITDGQTGVVRVVRVGAAVEGVQAVALVLRPRVGGEELGLAPVVRVGADLAELGARREFPERVEGRRPARLGVAQAHVGLPV
ncbi:DEAD/DEAH box helicase [Streptomyces sp. NPDC098085]|uniref:DEAD/DEAH box helicase n=1 Tax=Streptomyces sp. NPDC098085 TaxID=3366094 RepID=UPI0037F72AD2